MKEVYLIGLGKWGKKVYFFIKKNKYHLKNSY